MTLISARVSACDFVVKFSPSVCVGVAAYLTGDVAAQSFAYHVHGTADNDKSCSGSPPDDKASTSMKDHFW